MPFLRREAGERTCGKDGGDEWCRVEFALGHAQVAADVFAGLKHSGIKDGIRNDLGCSYCEK